MGKCLSCCEPVNSSSNSSCDDNLSGLAVGGGDNNKSQENSQSKEAKRSQTSSANYKSQLSSSSKTPNPSSAEASGKKMFPTYSKIPPIKKQANGDSKRLSLLCRDYSEQDIHNLFETYRDISHDMILAEGIETFCKDLDVKPEEFIVLILAWKFQAATMCCFTREEFVQGCKCLKVDSVKGIRSKFNDLLLEVQNKQNFRDFYRWTYKFGLESGQRTLPIDMAIILWKLIFTRTEPPILKHWLDFLAKHPDIRGIPKDTWDMFLNFTEQVGDDLSAYDDTEAWPSLFDDFVEYENDFRNQNVKTD
ncbi:DCN1-like protein 3 [Octopus bimaculoides]|uniref:Defective in cullin neddylation protein n=1 Tax=Octopus bimaculoides TaxID=37653 RepID=A0A0L8G670_OCTBM|nr:DCN1-like protein 3 [Octopus bimaculoides]XP_052827165.1 DCN1-like protein 3 [Octopus bimaculoides]XP_052827167.1 DCN1-like protein 3 [Octopus bimaculoides]|eukprot:XP_014783685.1 PREDICTED: DCN1-like protein 3 [Octopus bimaculoides]